MINYIDLFSGTGGIRLGLTRALGEFGIDSHCLFSAEIDSLACQTYSKNFEPISPVDITKIPDEFPKFDILLAGFPCQAFSYAGLRRGFEDTRGTLFFDVARIAKKNKPKILFLENVRGLLTHDKGRTFDVINKTLSDLGYRVQWRVINSSEMGVPQNRFRLYGIAVFEEDFLLTVPNLYGSKDTHSLTDESYISHKYIRDILEDDPSGCFDCSPEFTAALEKMFEGDLSKVAGHRCIDSRNGKSIHSWDLALKGSVTSDEKEMLELIIANRRKHHFGTHQDGKALTKEQIQTFYLKDNCDKILDSLVSKGYLRVDPGEKYNIKAGNMTFEVFKFLDPDGISITLTASDCNRLGVYHNGRLRKLTPRECARIQGYPDWYELHDNRNASYKQIGNAVSVPVVYQLFKNLFENNLTLLRYLKNCHHSFETAKEHLQEHVA